MLQNLLKTVVRIKFHISDLLTNTASDYRQLYLGKQVVFADFFSLSNETVSGIRHDKHVNKINSNETIYIML